MTRTTRMLLVVEHTESDDVEESSTVTTTGELVRARPIRRVATVPPSRGLEMQLGKLSGWLAKVAS